MRTHNLLAVCFILLVAVCHGQSTVWLTPERLTQLKQIKQKNHIVKVEQGKGGNVTYTWSDGIKTWQTTEKRKQVLGAKAVNGWQAKVDEEKAAKEEILNDLKAVASGKTISKTALNSVIEKAERNISFDPPKNRDKEVDPGIGNPPIKKEL